MLTQFLVLEVSSSGCSPPAPPAWRRRDERNPPIIPSASAGKLPCCAQASPESSITFSLIYTSGSSRISHFRLVEVCHVGGCLLERLPAFSAKGLLSLYTAALLLLLSSKGRIAPKITVLSRPGCSRSHTGTPLLRSPSENWVPCYPWSLHTCSRVFPFNCVPGCAP